jgi:FixJ family two-component response regulator
MAKTSAPPPPCIAVVEDDNSVRAAIRDLLRSAGLDSRGFRTAEGLLRSGIIRRIGCLIVDAHLPGMSGAALRERLLDRGVAVPVVIISADDRRLPPPQAGESPRDTIAFLSKPFDGGKLLRAVRTALRAPH